MKTTSCRFYTCHKDSYYLLTEYHTFLSNFTNHSRKNKTYMTYDVTWRACNGASIPEHAVTTFTVRIGAYCAKGRRKSSVQSLEGAPSFSEDDTIGVSFGPLIGVVSCARAANILANSLRTRVGAANRLHRPSRKRLSRLTDSPTGYTENHDHGHNTFITVSNHGVCGVRNMSPAFASRNGVFTFIDKVASRGVRPISAIARPTRTQP